VLPEGDRPQTFMMLDKDVVEVSLSTVCRVFSAAGRLDGWNRRASKRERRAAAERPAA